MEKRENVEPKLVAVILNNHLAVCASFAKLEFFS